MAVALRFVRGPIRTSTRQSPNPQRTNRLHAHAMHPEGVRRSGQGGLYSCESHYRGILQGRNIHCRPHLWPVTAQRHTPIQPDCAPEQFRVTRRRRRTGGFRPFQGQDFVYNVSRHQSTCQTRRPSTPTRLLARKRLRRRLPALELPRSGLVTRCHAHLPDAPSLRSTAPH